MAQLAEQLLPIRGSNIEIGKIILPVSKYITDIEIYYRRAFIILGTGHQIYNHLSVTSLPLFYGILKER